MKDRAISEGDVVVKIIHRLRHTALGRLAVPTGLLLRLATLIRRRRIVARLLWTPGRRTL